MLFEGPGTRRRCAVQRRNDCGSRERTRRQFFGELRDRQSLAYTVMAAPLIRSRAGAFSAYIAMSPEKEEAARSGLLGEFARLRGRQ